MPEKGGVFPPLKLSPLRACAEGGLLFGRKARDQGKEEAKAWGHRAQNRGLGGHSQGLPSFGAAAFPTGGDSGGCSD